MKLNQWFIAILAAVAILAGCGIFGPNPTPTATLDSVESNLTALENLYGSLPAATGTDYAGFETSFMQTFEVEHQSGLEARGLRVLMPPKGPSMDAKATIPVYNDSITFAVGGTGNFSNYPEPGLTTSYAIADASADVAGTGTYYKITATTTWPATNDVIDSYVEAYYVEDVSAGGGTADGVWDTNDPIVDTAGDEDPLYRVTMQMEFDDGSTRYETIVKLFYPGAPTPAPEGFMTSGFAAFDILADLDFPELAFPDTDAGADYSSIVVYTHTHATAPSFSFWSGTEANTILGVRYYTEHYVAAEEVTMGTLVAYEKAITTLVTTAGSDFVDQLVDVFVGSEHTVLAESVFRKEVVFDATAGTVAPSALAMNSIMRSHVVDVTSQTDEQLQILNDDTLRLLAWSGDTYHIPTGTADEVVLAAEPEPAEADLLHLIEENASNPDGSEIPLLLVTNQGPSDLATLYRSITEGALTITVTNDIPGTLDPPNAVLEFSGDVGASVADSPALDLTTEGTVEAWVWVDEHASWAGIVHKGEKADFSDEAYSLQFWGTKGNVAFAIVQQNPYATKTAKSRLRLNTGKWYYLVGTWDASFVNLYIRADGVSEDYNVANTLGSPAVTDGALVIGSQTLEDRASKGYYGFIGKINGVKVTGTAMTSGEVDAFYAANAALTADW